MPPPCGSMMSVCGVGTGGIERPEWGHRVISDVSDARRMREGYTPQYVVVVCCVCVCVSSAFVFLAGQKGTI